MRQYGDKWTKWICFVKNRHTFTENLGGYLRLNLANCVHCGVEFRGESYGHNTTTGKIRKEPF